jgi:hypothetical protein
MSNQPTQEQLFYQAHRKSADTNDAFLFLVKEGITRSELQRNIERRPNLWGRFSNWLSVLPETLPA